jgi:hypothetical protein
MNTFFAETIFYLIKNLKYWHIDLLLFTPFLIKLLEHIFAPGSKCFCNDLFQYPLFQ